MSYFFYNNTQKKNTFSSWGWVIIPLVLLCLGVLIVTNTLDPTITKIKQSIESLPEKVQELKQNQKYAALLKNSEKNKDYLQGIPIKEILRGGNRYIVNESATLPSVDAVSYVVGDVLSGEIIIEKNSTEELPIASVTKLMTASVALDELKETHIATVSKRATQTESSRGMLRANEQLEVSDLLYPLLLVSSNDSAEVLAETFGRKYFIQSMNRRAGEIGMQKTNFEDPSGLSPENTSTARDLFRLSEYLFNNHENVFQISKLKEYTQGGRVWRNANTLVGTQNYEGGKTGYTSKAGRTGVALFRVPFEGYGDRVIAITLLRTNNRAEDYNKLLEFIEKNVAYTTPEQKILVQAENKESVSLAFVGDIMLDRGVKTSVQNNFNGNYSKLFENLTDLKEADIAFANLEGPISDKGKNVGSKYSFRFDPTVTKALKEAGIDIVSFANNHVGDWSLEAFKDTLVRLKEFGILYTGADENKELAKDVKIIKSGDTKIGFLGFSDVGPNWIEAKTNQPGQLLASDPNRLQYIQEADKKVDILVVSYHWGDEYKEHNQRQTSLAYSSIDSGADIVIGHHPHVVQDTEIYKNKLIAYSLGNAIFDQYFSEETMEGMLLSVQVNKQGVVSHEEKIFKLNSSYQPQKPVTSRKVSEEEYQTITPSFNSLLEEIENIKAEGKNNCPKASSKSQNLILFNASQKNAVAKNFVPKDLVPIPESFIPTGGRLICTTQETLESLYAMHKDAKEAGVSIIPTSGFRSFGVQEQLFNTWKESEGKNAEYLAIAPPGHSEHHLGTTLDLTSEEIDFRSASQDFESTKSYEWLLENAHQYGFVQSYQRGTEETTGYIPESWHWRYLGRKHAVSIKNSGVSILEYLSSL